MAQYKNYINYNKNNKKNFLNEKVLILGSSLSLKKYKKKIEIFSKNLNLSVIAVNSNKIFNDKFINYRVVSHAKRIHMEYAFYNSFNNKFILPFKIINPKILNFLKINKVIFSNYDLKVSRNQKILVKNIQFLVHC